LSRPGTSRSGEDDLIARYFRPLAKSPGALGLIDDAAILAGSDDDLVVTTDAIVEGVHFLPDDPPETIARKALRVNLSDLAAKGAMPAGFVLTLALRNNSDAFLAPFAQALGADAAAFGCPLLGGDTVSTPGPLMISITAFGRVPKGKMVKRNGALADDCVLVTGTIGDAALGLQILKGGVAPNLDVKHRDDLVMRYRVPQPRLALASSLRDHASAAMDVSDGLAGDLAKLCAASGASAEIDIARIPLSTAAHAAVSTGVATIEALMSGGDDYEVLCTVPQNRLASFEAAAKSAGVPVTVVGHIVTGSAGPAFIGRDGQPTQLKRMSYSHF
jgi:thiamine-monophosphate kinase